jgi:hypothetical protein
MRDMKRSIRNIAALVAAVVTVTGAALAAPDGCVSANVPGRIVLPDGRSYPAGPIRVCLTEQISPIAGLHKTTVDGQPVGMFLSRFGPVEASPADRPEPTLHFLRTEDGAWILEAYAIAVGKRVILFKLREDPPGGASIASVRGATGQAVILAAVAGR